MRAVEDRPDDLGLRLLLADLLLDAQEAALAVGHLASVLDSDPGNEEARQLFARANRSLIGEPPTGATPSSDGFDWSEAEAQVEGIIAPTYVDGIVDVSEMVEQPPAVRLADVAGMDHVKRRLETTFLLPMRNPDLQAMYGRSLSGGMLLYGPPGCGKTFLARAIAGELGASFHTVSLGDVLDMWLGSSERNLRAVFDTARSHAPSVLFLDEIDALGQKRSHLRANAAMRGTVNQLLSEMDSVKANNDGVFVLGATNHPWDVDTALLRPGRFARTLLVGPPDKPARQAILRYHLRDRPVEGVNLRKLAARTDEFSGADLAHLCDTAAEFALEDSLRSGRARHIGMGDFVRALKEIRASTGAWLDDARNVVLFANQGGRYDDLLAYLKERGMA
jgi:SpoVK/Ycf46/Vps4 family AAA+-type ATPase